MDGRKYINSRIMIWTSRRDDEQTRRQTDTGFDILWTRDIGMVQNIELY